MHLCSTFFVLLLLTWMEQGSCAICNGNALTSEKRELFALYDRIEAAIKPFLPSKELKDMVHDINEKLKSRLCDVNIEGKGLLEVLKTGNEFLNKVLNKKANTDEIIAFMVKGIFDNFDNMISGVMNKPPKKA
ncbi:uncharacterized protein LOC143930797 [Lithobates pipiens]